jgi:predicted transcriptional regulator of viral defense system
MPKLFSQEIAIFLRQGGTLRMAEALQAGVSRRALYAMREQGVVETISRGVYRLTDLPGLEMPDLVAVARRVPRGVICLISALAFHELTTQIPHAVDVAVLRGMERPRIDYPPTHIYFFSQKSFESGVEIHEVDGQRLRVYSREKCVADAFKYRTKIGMDVALEALRTWRSEHRGTVESLMEQARVCRVANVMKPYLEASL